METLWAVFCRKIYTTSSLAVSSEPAKSDGKVSLCFIVLQYKKTSHNSFISVITVHYSLNKVLTWKKRKKKKKQKFQTFPKLWMWEKKSNLLQCELYFFFFPSQLDYILLPGPFALEAPESKSIYASNTSSNKA